MQLAAWQMFSFAHDGPRVSAREKRGFGTVAMAERSVDGKVQLAYALLA